MRSPGSYKATADPIHESLDGAMEPIDSIVINAGLTPEYLGALADDPVALRAWLEQI